MTVPAKIKSASVWFTVFSVGYFLSKSSGMSLQDALATGALAKELPPFIIKVLQDASFKYAIDAAKPSYVDGSDAFTWINNESVEEAVGFAVADIVRGQKSKWPGSEALIDSLARAIRIRWTDLAVASDIPEQLHEQVPNWFLMPVTDLAETAPISSSDWKEVLQYFLSFIREADPDLDNDSALLLDDQCLSSISEAIEREFSQTILRAIAQSENGVAYREALALALGKNFADIGTRLGTIDAKQDQALNLLTEIKDLIREQGPSEELSSLLQELESLRRSKNLDEQTISDLRDRLDGERRSQKELEVENKKLKEALGQASVLSEPTIEPPSPSVACLLSLRDSIAAQEMRQLQSGFRELQRQFPDLDRGLSHFSKAVNMAAEASDGSTFSLRLPDSLLVSLDQGLTRDLIQARWIIDEQGWRFGSELLLNFVVALEGTPTLKPWKLRAFDPDGHSSFLAFWACMQSMKDRTAIDRWVTELANRCLVTLEARREEDQAYQVSNRLAARFVIAASKVAPYGYDQKKLAGVIFEFVSGPFFEAFRTGVDDSGYPYRRKDWIDSTLDAYLTRAGLFAKALVELIRGFGPEARSFLSELKNRGERLGSESTIGTFVAGILFLTSVEEDFAQEATRLAEDDNFLTLIDLVGRDPTSALRTFREWKGAKPELFHEIMSWIPYKISGFYKGTASEFEFGSLVLAEFRSRPHRERLSRAEMILGLAYLPSMRDEVRYDIYESIADGNKYSLHALGAFMDSDWEFVNKALIRYFEGREYPDFPSPLIVIFGAAERGVEPEKWRQLLATVVDRAIPLSNHSVNSEVSVNFELALYKLDGHARNVVLAELCRFLDNISYGEGLSCLALGIHAGKVDYAHPSYAHLVRRLATLIADNHTRKLLIHWVISMCPKFGLALRLLAPMRETLGRDFFEKCVMAALQTDFPCGQPSNRPFFKTKEYFQDFREGMEGIEAGKEFAELFQALELQGDLAHSDLGSDRKAMSVLLEALKKKLHGENVDIDVSAFTEEDDDDEDFEASLT